VIECDKLHVGLNLLTRRRACVLLRFYITFYMLTDNKYRILWCGYVFVFGGGGGGGGGGGDDDDGDHSCYKVNK
jgi:hypothetical protein